VGKGGARDRGRRVLIAIAAAGISAWPIAAAGSVGPVTGDITPPSLQSLALSPTTVDDSASGAWLYFTAHITDDYSGVDQGRSGATIYSPGGGAYGCANCSFLLQSGTDTDGVFQAKAYVPQGATPGTWGVSLSLYDKAGNVKNWTTSDLEAAGYPHQFTVTNSSGDATPPKLAGVQIITQTVDVSSGDSVFDVQLHATDDKSGVSMAITYLVDPKQTNGGAFPQSPYGNGTLVSGTVTDGWWDYKVVIPQHTHAGTWSLGVRLDDAAGNYVDFSPTTVAQDGYPDTFSVNSPNPDNDPPQLVSFSITPPEVDVHDSDQTVTVQAHITDNMTGVVANTIDTSLQSPIRHQDDRPMRSFQLMSGSTNDGVFQATITIPKASETGAWPIGVGMNDRVANLAMYGLWGSSLATVGALPYEVVYNIPLPPFDLRVNPGDTTALIQWQPGDDQGARITQYTVTESPQGLTASVDGSKNSLLMGGLQNGVQHSFVITATNKAGPSAPSPSASGTPQAGLPPPQPQMQPSPGGSAGPAGATTTASGQPSAGAGYWFVAADGGIFSFGDAAFFGSTGAQRLNQPIVAVAPTPDRQGYWLVGSDGGVSSFGDAAFFGSTGAQRLNQPIVGMAPTPSGHGYWLLARDGGIFSFGDAAFFGSTGAQRLNQPILGMAPTPSGHGYWFVAADGGIFAFGDARFFGSMGAVHLNQPIVGMARTPDGAGYWLVAADGGIFSFGDAGFYGSTGSIRLNRPISGMAA